MTDGGLTTVIDMIRDAFGDPESNTVNLKLIASVMFILAKDLGLLERRFFVECDWLAAIPTPQISITEITIKANVEKVPTIIKIAETPSQIAKAMARAAHQARGPKPKKIKRATKSFEEELVSSSVSEDDILNDEPEPGPTYKTDKKTTDKASSDKTQSVIKPSGKTSDKKPGKASTDKESIGKSPTASQTTKKSEKAIASSSSSSTSSSEITSLSPSAAESAKTAASDKSAASAKSTVSKKDSKDASTTASLHSEPKATKMSKEKIMILTDDTEPKPTSSTVSRKLSLVTKEQFEVLAKSVVDLKKQYEAASSGIPESSVNKTGLPQFYKSASLTDPVAILQLSARLEAIEKSTDHILKLLNDISKTTPRIDPKKKIIALDKELAVLKSPDEDFTIPETKESKISSKETSGAQKKDKVLKSPDEDFIKPETKESTISSKETSGAQKKDKELHSQSAKLPVSEVSVSVLKAPSGTLKEDKGLHSESVKKAISGVSVPEEIHETKSGVIAVVKPTGNFITRLDLRHKINDMVQTFNKEISDIVDKNVTKKAADSTSLAALSEKRLTQGMSLEISLVEVEDAVTSYADHINRLDTAFSSKMTEYQESLTQMIYDMEKALDSMIESVATSGEVTAEINDLNAQFTRFQVEILNTSLKQDTLKEKEATFQRRLVGLQSDVVGLETMKSSRSEVEMCMEDKAGIRDFNEMVDKDYFLAVTGDCEKRIRAAYDKFNSQEYTWQKLIDESHRDLNKRADRYHLEILSENIDFNVAKMKKKIDFMLEILGEPRQPEPRKYMFNEDTCLSCDVNVKDKILPSADGDHGAVGKKETKRKSIAIINTDNLLEISQKCYPGHKIPHPPEPRSRVCTRFCGGPLNLQRRSKVPNSDLNIEKLVRDTKPENVLEVNIEPCLPCNTMRTMRKLSKPDVDALPAHGILRSSMVTPLPLLNPALATGELANIVTIDETSLLQISEFSDLRQVF